MFRAGQKVVCVDASGGPTLTEGAVYTIHRIEGPFPGRFRDQIGEMYGVFLYEVEPDPQFYGFHPSRFRPAVDRPTDISVFTRMLKPEKTDA